jgi:hypothetical protein
MLSFLATFAGGAGLYLLLCAATALTGRGLLRLGRAGVGGKAEWALAAVLGFLFWSLALGLAAALRVPVRAAAPWLGGASLLLALLGLYRPWASLRAGGLLVAVCALLPVAAMAPTFRTGLTATTETLAQDGWAYAAAAEYFRDFHRGEPGGGAVVTQFGALMADKRYVGFCLLALFRPLVAPVEPLAVIPLLQAWSLFATASAVLLFWLAQGWRPAEALALAALTATGGWLRDLVWCNNLDQGLSLVYMPALAAAPALFGPGDWRRWALLGALLAGVAYTYPELAPFEAGGAALLGLPHLWRERGRWAAWLAGTAAAAALAALLVWPARAALVAFTRQQARGALAANGPRPGDGIFEGLHDPEKLAPAAWGLGGESFGKPYSVRRRLYAEALTLLAALGLVVLARRGQWGVSLAAAVLGAAALYVLVRRHYAYGCYKVLSADWWLMAGAAFAGAGWLLGKVPRRPWRAAAACAGCGAALGLNLSFGQTVGLLWQGLYDGASAAEFRPVRSVGRATGGRPLLLAVDEWKANLLALLYLRDTPFHLAARRSYLHVAGEGAFREQHRPGELAGLRYVLSDDTPQSRAWHAAAGAPVWACGHYLLWEAAPRQGDARLLYADGPCEGAWQLEQRGGRPFVWLRDQPTALYAYAARAGRLRLRGDFEVGPSLPGRGSCRLEVRGPLGDRQVVDVAAGEQTLTVPVPAGVSRFVVRPLDEPLLRRLPNWEMRTLLLGVTVVAVGLDPEGEAAGGGTGGPR